MCSRMDVAKTEVPTINGEMRLTNEETECVGQEDKLQINGMSDNSHGQTMNKTNSGFSNDSDFISLNGTNAGNNSETADLTTGIGLGSSKCLLPEQSYNSSEQSIVRSNSGKLDVCILPDQVSSNFSSLNSTLDEKNSESSPLANNKIEIASLNSTTLLSTAETLEGQNIENVTDKVFLTNNLHASALLQKSSSVTDHVTTKQEALPTDLNITAAQPDAQANPITIESDTLADIRVSSSVQLMTPSSCVDSNKPATKNPIIAQPDVHSSNKVFGDTSTATASNSIVEGSETSSATLCESSEKKTSDDKTASCAKPFSLQKIVISGDSNTLVKSLSMVERPESKMEKLRATLKNGDNSASATSSTSQTNTATKPEMKAAFNLKPPATQQEVKDGMAYLRPTSKFLYQIGLSMIREVVYEGLADHVEEQRLTGNHKYSKKQQDSLEGSLAKLHEDNNHLKLKYNKKCDFEYGGRQCGFRTESALVLELHKSEGHSLRTDRVFCARCDYTTTIDKCFRSHQLEKHGMIGSVVKPPSFYPCRLCFYETNFKNKYILHQVSCEKNFRLERNLRPDRMHWTPFGEDALLSKPTDVRKPVSLLPMPSAKPLPVTTVSTKDAPMKNSSLQLIMPGNKKVAIANTNAVKTSYIKGPSVQPIAPQLTPQRITQIGGTMNVNMNNKPDMEVVSCEVCGGYIQGMSAYKVHMQWVHQINISHMQRPTFECTEIGCSQKFWSVQGIARHAKMFCKHAQKQVSENANRCFLCMKPLSKSLVEHILQFHLENLKKMVETRTCMSEACKYISFPTVDILQQHMARQHKLQMTGLSGLRKTNALNIKFQPFCSICKMKFNGSNEFARHCALNHVHKCNICGAQCSTPKSLVEHEDASHKNRYCLACCHAVGRKSFLHHCLTIHKASAVRVKLKRLPSSQYEFYSKKPKVDW